MIQWYSMYQYQKCINMCTNHCISLFICKTHVQLTAINNYVKNPITNNLMIISIGSQLSLNINLAG